ncbi:MAG TPA: ankyrin repeat domain-containing protein, partial [Vicinamibacterales bacterium]|nr:ankyrin repeat domain-containing protein [Vicinamibacterales bacterium]
MRFAATLLVLAIAVPAWAAGSAPPLVAAMKTGDVAAVRTLVERKVDINATEVDGTSALHWAVRA